MTINLGVVVKSRMGTGILVTIYSTRASMLYRSWAEMGTMGARSATVPLTKVRMDWWCSTACCSVMRSTLFCVKPKELADERFTERRRGRTNLENQDVLELHDFDRGEMLGSLGLGASFVGGNEEESGVHDGGTVQHGSHQNIVTRAIDERDMTEKDEGLVRKSSKRKDEEGSEVRTEAASFGLHIQVLHKVGCPPCPSCNSCSILVGHTLLSRTYKSAPKSEQT